jgi:predicted O-linked N-acetylglucosamine transferase (SPINDLY family)
MHESLAPPPKADKPKEEEEVVFSPVVALEELDLADELYSHYIAARRMFEASKKEPLNQRAQTINSVVNVLGRIATIRTELFNSERMKKMEEVLIKVLKDFPEVSESFITAYEEALSEV